MKGYRKLQVYEKSYRLVVEIYRITQRLPKEELYAMTSQIRRAAASIPLNIAEGYAKRESQAEFKRYLMMALGSNAEMNVLLDLVKDLSYISKAEYDTFKSAYEEVGKMITTLTKRVEERI